MSSLLLTALFSAFGLTSIAAVHLLPLEVGPTMAYPLGETFAPAGRDSDRILSGNMFGGSDPLRVESSTCDPSLRLVGAIHNAGRPQQSFASIAVQGHTDLFRTGDLVGDYALTEIRTSTVVLSGMGGLCSVPMFSASSAYPSSENPSVVPELSLGVRRSSDFGFLISRDHLEEALPNLERLTQGLRGIPHVENGRWLGVRVYGVRANSAIAQLGIENGDLIRSVNGFNVSSADGVLEAMSRLRNADHISASVLRQGRPLTLDYEIR